MFGKIGEIMVTWKSDLQTMSLKEYIHADQSPIYFLPIFTYTQNLKLWLLFYLDSLWIIYTYFNFILVSMGFALRILMFLLIYIVYYILAVNLLGNDSNKINQASTFKMGSSEIMTLYEGSALFY